MSTTENWGTTLGVWVAVSTGIVTALGALYGVYREWQAYRQNQVQRLANAAMVAVRRAEANLVRPLLRERMTDTIQRFATRPAPRGDGLNEVTFRVLLFCELHDGMRLTDAEKKQAHTVATNHLIAALRAMPSPPVHVYTDSQVTKHSGLLQELVENAYSTRIRPNTDLLQQLALFIGVSGVPSPTCAS